MDLRGFALNYFIEKMKICGSKMPSVSYSTVNCRRFLTHRGVRFHAKSGR